MPPLKTILMLCGQTFKGLVQHPAHQSGKEVKMSHVFLLGIFVRIFILSTVIMINAS